MTTSTPTAQEWRRLVLSDVTWEIDPNFARPRKGEAKGNWVRSQHGTLGYMKPTKQTPNRYRAAYEKIAADLAFEVGVNVPPVVLYERPTPPTGEERFVCISLVPEGTFFDWKDVFAGVANKGVEALLCHHLKSGSGGVAFDAWLGNTDRHNPDNSMLIIGTDVAICFLDFANTMNYDGSWARGEYQTIKKPKLPALFAQALIKKEVKETAKLVAALDDGLVRDIIQNRMTDSFMPAAVRIQTADWMIWRKKELFNRFDTWYPN